MSSRFSAFSAGSAFQNSKRRGRRERRGWTRESCRGIDVAIPITVPRLGWSMEEGTFVEWLKRDGDTINVGDPLFVLESEKAAESIEALDAGILRIPGDGPAGGAIVKVGQVLAYLAKEGEE